MSTTHSERMERATTTIGDSGIAHWALRIAIAGTFIFHGVGKFANLEAGAEKFGVPLSMWIGVSVAEVVAPVLLLLGGLMSNRLGDILTRLGGAIIVPIMLGAIWLVHWGQWSFAASETHPAGGMEFQVALALIGLYFVLRGNNA